MPALEWTRDRASWPHAAASRFIEAGGWRWHVQHFGPAPGAATPARPLRRSGREAALPPPRATVLLLHGTGASGHSFRHLAPLLATADTQVLVPDLPGHAFTQSVGGRDVSLPGVATAVAALLAALGAQPTLIVGHSAGAAVGAQLCLAGLAAPERLVSLNGALLPLQGPVQQWFSPLARWLVANPFVPHLFAWQAAQPGVARRLVASTGSRLDDEGVALYGRLVADPRHAAGALRLMASWQLGPLAAALPNLRTPLVLVVGSADATVPPAQSHQVQQRVPAARMVTLPGLGHLAHEEDPQAVLAAIADAGSRPSARSSLAAEAGTSPAPGVGQKAAAA